MTEYRCPVCQERPARRKYCSRACQLKARRQPPTPESVVHIVIPDTQVKPGVPVDHLSWIGRFVRERYGDYPGRVKIVHLGDHWDMPSLSSYDQGKRSMEGRRVRKDLDAGNEAFGILDRSLGGVGARERHFLYGNHEERIARAAEQDPQLDGLLGYDQLDTRGWRVHDYLDTLPLDGITYSHYFYNPLTGRPYGGNVETRLKTVGFSFTMGHQQGLWWGRRELADGSAHIGLIAGACYLHDEGYKGPQGNRHWRGIVVCENVSDGEYDPSFISLDWLCRRFEGCRLAAFTPEVFV